MFTRILPLVLGVLHLWCISGVYAQGKRAPRDVQLLELEMAIASYGLIKNTQNQQKLVDVYHNLIAQDCSAGDPTLPLEKRKLTFETDCQGFIKGLLEVNDKDTVAICLRDGSTSRACRNAQAGIFGDETPENPIDALDRYLSMPPPTVLINPGSAELTMPGEAPKFTPDFAELEPVAQELQYAMRAYQGSNSDLNKGKLVDVFERYILIVCPDPRKVLYDKRFAQWLKKAPDECTNHGKTLLSFDAESTLARCFTEGYSSTACKEYVKDNSEGINPPSPKSNQALEKF